MVFLSPDKGTVFESQNEILKLRKIFFEKNQKEVHQNLKVAHFVPFSDSGDDRRLSKTVKCPSKQKKKVEFRMENKPAEAVKGITKGSSSKTSATPSSSISPRRTTSKSADKAGVTKSLTMKELKALQETETSRRSSRPAGILKNRERVSPKEKKNMVASESHGKKSSLSKRNPPEVGLKYPSKNHKELNVGRSKVIRQKSSQDSPSKAKVKRLLERNAPAIPNDSKKGMA